MVCLCGNCSHADNNLIRKFRLRILPPHSRLEPVLANLTIVLMISTQLCTAVGIMMCWNALSPFSSRRQLKISANDYGNTFDHLAGFL